MAAGETVSSNRPIPATVSLNAATSDSISQVSPKIVVSALHPVAAHVNLLLCSPLSQKLSSASLKGLGQLWKPSQSHQKPILLVGLVSVLQKGSCTLLLSHSCAACSWFQSKHANHLGQAAVPSG